MGVSATGIGTLGAPTPTVSPTLLGGFATNAVGLLVRSSDAHITGQNGLSEPGLLIASDQLVLSFASATGYPGILVTLSFVRLTQLGAEVWNLGTPSIRLTQLGAEIWNQGTPAIRLTQIGVEIWSDIHVQNVFGFFMA
jgi:hypothetical protein